MGYRLREFETEIKFSRELTLEAIGQAVPMAEIKAELAKIRADPDYSTPYCVGCGGRFQTPLCLIPGREEYDPSLYDMLGPNTNYTRLYAYGEDDLLCTDCMDAEVIEDAKATGEWDGDEEDN